MRISTTHVLLAALAVGGVLWVRRQRRTRAVTAAIQSPVADPLIKFLTVSSLNPYSGNYRAP